MLFCIYCHLCMCFVTLLTGGNKDIYLYFFCVSVMLLMVCVCQFSCASVYCCRVVTRWERDDLLAIVCDVLQ